MFKYSQILKFAEGGYIGPISVPAAGRTIPEKVNLIKGETTPGPYTPYVPDGFGKLKLADHILAGPYPRDIINTNEHIKPGQTATLAFSGAHPSDRFLSLADIAPHGVAEYRYNDRRRASRQVDDLYRKGIRDFRVIGHSRGGYAADRLAARIQRKYPDAKVDIHLTDPVVDSWLKRFAPWSRKLKSKGAKVYLPSEPHAVMYQGKPNISNLVAMLGGRMDTRSAESISTWNGVHSAGQDIKNLVRNLSLFGKTNPSDTDREWYATKYPHIIPGYELSPLPLSQARVAPMTHVLESSPKH